MEDVLRIVVGAEVGVTVGMDDGSNILDGDKVVTNNDGPSAGDKYVDIDGGNVGVSDGRSDGY